MKRKRRTANERLLADMLASDNGTNEVSDDSDEYNADDHSEGFSPFDPDVVETEEALPRW